MKYLRKMDKTNGCLKRSIKVTLFSKTEKAKQGQLIIEMKQDMSIDLGGIKNNKKDIIICVWLTHVYLKT